MKNLYTAVVHKEDELYVAECPEVGTASQGETIEEAVMNLQEATELYLEEFPQKITHHPFLTTFEESGFRESKEKSMDSSENSVYSRYN